MQTNKLQKIIYKYEKIQTKESNYYIGGGLADTGNFESNRHAQAKDDVSRITLGNATQIFKRATELTTQEIKDIILFTYPYLEWHHAGRLPREYGGRMKKTYFLNSKQMVDFATNFYEYKQQYEHHINEERIKSEQYRIKLKKKTDYLKKHAKPFERITELPKYYIITNEEMNGKYGWFNAQGKDYNLTIYYTGWEFKTQQQKDKYNNL